MSDTRNKAVASPNTVASPYLKASPLQKSVEKLAEEQTQLAIYHGKATDAMATMSSRDAIVDQITGRATIDNGEVKLVVQKFDSLQGSLGVNTHKLLTVGVSEFTAINNYDRREDRPIQPAITFSLAEYAKDLGYDVEEHPTDNEEDALKEKKRVQRVLNEAQKKIKRELQVLQATTLTWEEKVKGKAGDYDSVSLFSRTAIRKGVVYMEFSLPMAKYLVLLPITQYPKTQLRIDGRNQNAYALGNKFAEHYNMDSNQKKGTANRLKVDTLLRITNLPTYEQTIKNRNSWIDRIKEPFETALDEVVRVGTLADWEYTHSKGVPLTEEEASNITDYKTFSELYITYRMGEEVDHTERLARRAEEEEKRQDRRKKKKRKPKS